MFANNTVLLNILIHFRNIQIIIKLIKKLIKLFIRKVSRDSGFIISEKQIKSNLTLVCCNISLDQGCPNSFYNKLNHTFRHNRRATKVYIADSSSSVLPIFGRKKY